METLSVRDIARMLGITEHAVYTRRCYYPESLPPSVKVGNRVRYMPDTVKEWMAEHEEGHEDD